MAWTLKRERGRDMLLSLRLYRLAAWKELRCIATRWGFGSKVSLRHVQRRSSQSRRSFSLGASPEKKLQPRRRDAKTPTSLDMQKLSRTSLAALVCPSAPFLAPRLLRATVPITANTIRSAPSSLQKSCYATKPKGKAPIRKLLVRPERDKRAPGAFVVEDQVCVA